jgi:hypothetical protein
VSVPLRSISTSIIAHLDLFRDMINQGTLRIFNIYYHVFHLFYHFPFIVKVESLFKDPEVKHQFNSDTDNAETVAILYVSQFAKYRKVSSTSL